MFIREVATSDKDGNVIRYAQVVASYRNAEGKPRHKVLLSLGRVDRIDREMLRRFVRNLLRYIGDESSLLRPRIVEVRELGLGVVVAGMWTKLGFGTWLGREATKVGLDAQTERSLLAWITATLAGIPYPEDVLPWLRHDAYLAPELGPAADISLEDARSFVLRARVEIERGLYLRRSSPDGTVYVKSHTCPVSSSSDRGPADARMEVVLSCDSQGFPVAAEVGQSKPGEAPALVDRLRKMGARRIVWSRDAGPPRDDLQRHVNSENGSSPEIPPEARRTLQLLRRSYECCVDPDVELVDQVERIDAQLAMLVLARIIARRVEVESGQAFEALRMRLRPLRAIHLVEGDQTRWESTPLSPDVETLFAALGLEHPPRTLPPPDALPRAPEAPARVAQVTND